MEKSTEDKYPGAVIFKKLSISAVVEKKNWISGQKIFPRSRTYIFYCFNQLKFWYLLRCSGRTLNDIIYFPSK